MYMWDKVFKNGPSKICGRQPLKKFLLKFYFHGFPQFSSTNFTLSILEYFVPYVSQERASLFILLTQSTYVFTTAPKIKFSIKNFFSKCD